MASLLSEHTQDKNNNFNLLRLIAAVAVLFTHSFALTGRTSAEPVHAVTGLFAGDLAVNVFFITSGFLVTRSILTRKNITEFFWARVLRIYPALVIMVLFCAVLLGLLFTVLPAATYLSSSTVYQFILNNGSLVAGRLVLALPGVFTATPYPAVVNGSIWTLQWEIRLYMFLAFLALVSWNRGTISGKRLGFWLITLASLLTIVHIGNRFYPVYHGFGMNSALRFGSLFFLGSAFFVLRDRIVLSHRVFFAFLTLLLLFAGRSNLYYLLLTLALPYVVFYLAYKPDGWLRQFNRLGDYSYGTYLYAFPVQQSLAATFPGLTVPAMFFASLVITLMLAALSWHLVEKYMLEKKQSAMILQNALFRLRRPSA